MVQVLVVEDDGLTREMRRDVLKLEGYHVITAPDGCAALAHLWMTATPLVVLVDERMPGLTGSQLVEAYLGAGVPTAQREFILLTASPRAIVTSLNGRLPVVGKPFKLETLLEAIVKAAVRLGER
jgi:CheY-like chemotaxis protein